MQLENQKKETERQHLRSLENHQEIHNQDNKIAFKEKSILYLKKKTQELEKFKFVLDYKIKELRRDIAPREMEIVTLRQRTNTMDKELNKYNDLNAALGFMVDDLRTRQETLQEVIKRHRDIVRSNESYISGFKNAVYWVVQYTDDYEQLKRVVNNSLYKYIEDQQSKNVEVDPDIRKEYENQRKYLYNSMHSLDKRLEMERSIHKEDNMRIMYMNKELIEHITTLRGQITTKERVQRQKINTLKEKKSQYGVQGDIEQQSIQQNASSDALMQENHQKNMEIQHQEIYDLEQHKQQSQAYIEEIRARIDEQKQELMNIQQMLGQGQN